MEFRRVLFRSREQLRVRRGRGDDDVEEVQRYRRGAAEPWQQRVDLGYQQRAWQTGGDDGVDGVKGQVGIGRQRQLRALRVRRDRSEEHTSELQSLMRISYAVFCLKKKNTEDSITPRCKHIITRCTN